MWNERGVDGGLIRDDWILKVIETDKKTAIVIVKVRWKMVLISWG